MNHDLLDRLRWSRLSQVERVELYTKQSIYLLMWSLQAVFLSTLVTRTGGPAGGTAAVVVGTVVITVAASRVLHRVANDYPDSYSVPWDVTWPLAVLVALAVPALFLLEPDDRFPASLLVWAPVAWCLSGVRGRAETVGLVVVVALVAGVAGGEVWAAPYAVAMTLFFVFTVRASLWLLDIVTELDRTRDAQSALAVAEERLRFSRDVHDVMGRHLSTIAVQAELAANLAARGDERAAPQMLEVRGVAHDALREARELARGYRATDLGQELEGARSLLGSAGIDVRLDVDALPPSWHEAAGWLIREGVTNVLRHSSATCVVIAYAAPTLSLTNDGAHDGGSDGSGLAGLRERLAPLGARLDAERTGDTFVLAATLPPGGPAGPAGPAPAPSGDAS